MKYLTPIMMVVVWLSIISLWSMSPSKSSSSNRNMEKHSVYKPAVVEAYTGDETPSMVGRSLLQTDTVRTPGEKTHPDRTLTIYNDEFGLNLSSVVSQAV